MKNLIENNNSPYVIIEKDDNIFIGTGKIHELENLSELENLQKETKNKIVFITPFCLARVEKGHDALGSEKIIAMEVENEINTTKEELLKILPNEDIKIGDIITSVSDEEFGKKVENVKIEIENGEACQCIISRKFNCDCQVLEKLDTLYYTKNQLLLAVVKMLENPQKDN